MRVVDVAVRQCYRFNCPNCGSRLEADCGDLADIDESTLEAAIDGMKVDGEFAKVAAGDRVAEAGMKAGLFKSISEARKTIKSGGVYLNNNRIEDEEQVLAEADFLAGRFALIRRGKKALGAVENR